MRRPRIPASGAERARRKRVAVATLLTCIAAAMIGGSLHVMVLGSKRMDEMRAKAGYDPRQMASHIRAAGEEIQIQLEHEAAGGRRRTYTVEEADSLLTQAWWKELAKMVVIPAGPFLMGTDDPRSNIGNRPQHRVVLKRYAIDKYPVTQAQYARFVAAMHYRPPLNWVDGRIPRGLELHPVTMVSWYNARDYCKWAGKRLPTEAEWEKAARGTDGRRWPWGNDLRTDAMNTYYSVRHTTPVNRYPQGASPYGVMDMAGNVSEWTASVYAPYPGSKADAKLFRPQDLDPDYQAGPDEKAGRAIYRVRRGGSWKSDPFATSTYHRNYSRPNYASDFFGFRCARELP
ncbi:MAG: formylglycine-generating enzyme family protein [Zetaproteobacteria bacterium]|nr:MAG: formylglycine-generating enzyme family protein [Zetaproteobacteria bacterium]